MMKKFLIKLSFFVFPLILFAVFILITDPFKIFFSYNDYYKNNFITLNREMVCLKTYIRNRHQVRFNSFIFGSSRSQAFKISHWVSYLPGGSSGFHFDAWGEGLYGISNKIRFIDQSGDKIKNALIVVDEDVMKVTTNRKGQLYISPPELSGESSLYYYMTFLKDIFDFRFLIGYTDYYLFRTYRPYMKWFFNNPLYAITPDNITCDVYYSYDKMTAESQTAYYEKLVRDGTFYDRSKKNVTQNKITDREKELLSNIRNILTKHNSDYKIIISPTYDQISYDSERLQMLYSLFGRNRVYNFSGKNKFTNSMYNYYDNSHYRKEVADEIMRIIYSDSVSVDSRYRKKRK